MKPENSIRTFIMVFLLAVMMTFGGTISAFADPIEVSPGVVNVQAISKVYTIYSMIDTVIIEYTGEVTLPSGEPEDLFSFIDEGSKDLRDDYDRRPSSEREVIAVYTNSTPEPRSSQTSTPGKYVIIQLAEMKGSIEVDWDTAVDDTFIEKGNIKYAPLSVGGLTTWRKSNMTVEEFRKDYSDLKITQKVAFTVGGQAVPAGLIPTIEFEDVSWPYDVDKFILSNEIDRNGGDYKLYYSYHLPDNYDPNREYPLVVNMSGNGGRLYYPQPGGYPANLANMLGSDVARDRGALAWLDASEDVIILSPQIWRNTPREWGKAAADQNTYAFVGWFSDKSGGSSSPSLPL